MVTQMTDEDRTNVLVVFAASRSRFFNRCGITFKKGQRMPPSRSVVTS
jgi:hypothetical protein